jgi:hypothetical protein
MWCKYLTKTPSEQAVSQIIALGVTILIALASGNLFGWICKNEIFSPP